MTKSAKRVAIAFKNETKAKTHNCICTGNAVTLYKTTIARRDENGHIVVNFAGWTTKTTLSYVNAICNAFGARRFYTRKGELFGGNTSFSLDKYADYIIHYNN